MIRRAYRWLGIRLGLTVGILICEPQLRLGRRRHDGDCDNCETGIEMYYAERLTFPDEEAETTRGMLARMMRAEYERVCLECSAKLEEREP